MFSRFGSVSKQMFIFDFYAVIFFRIAPTSRNMLIYPASKGSETYVFAFLDCPERHALLRVLLLIFLLFGLALRNKRFLKGSDLFGFFCCSVTVSNLLMF